MRTRKQSQPSINDSFLGLQPTGDYLLPIILVYSDADKLLNHNCAIYKGLTIDLDGLPFERYGGCATSNIFFSKRLNLH